MTAYCLHHLLLGRDDRGDQPAIEDVDAQITWSAFAARAIGIAKHLRALGLEPGDRVAIALPKSIDACVAIFGVSAAGGVFVPVNQQLMPGQVAHIVGDCSARFVLTDGAQADRLSAAFAEIDAEPALVLVDDAANPDYGAASAVALRDCRLGEDLAAILYTSGSTGSPKGVMLSHRNLLAGTRIVRTYLSITPEDRLLSILPLSFDYGLNQLTTVAEQRATLVLTSFRLGDELVACLADKRITGLAGVPAIWAILTRAAPSLARTNLPHLRYITNSGGAVPSETVKRLRTHLPDTDIFLMYGLTEAFRSTFLPPDMIDAKPTSIGKAIPECEVFAVTKDGRRAQPGEAGILVHRGPTVSLGYWNRPEATAAVLKPNPFVDPTCGGDTVCYSGDLVTTDEDGFLYFVARDDAMIKSAGFRISPTEVEEVLMATERFAQVAVIGLPDTWTGQKVVAVGVPTDASLFADDRSAADAAVRDLRTFVGTRVPTYMVPKAIEFVSELPVTGNGKVDYKRLVAERS